MPYLSTANPRCQVQAAGLLLLDRGDSIVPEIYTHEDLGCNARITVYADGTVDDAICCSRNIYTQPGYEQMSYSPISRLPWEQYSAACHGHVPHQLIAQVKQHSTHGSAADSAAALRRSRRRAIESVYEYIRNNTDLDCFVTLTLAQERQDVDKLAAHLKEYLGKAVQRSGLKYIAVYEYHHDGKALHVHLLCNQSALDLVRATSARTGRQLSHKDAHGHWHAVYNVANWRYGYSTAIKCYGNRIAIAKYVTKYVTKSEKKIRGRWYMHSHNIARPAHRYYQVCYNDVIGRAVTAPPEAHLTIKYTTPEQIALHIDTERDLHCDRARSALSALAKQKYDKWYFYFALDRAPEGQLSSAAGDLDRTSKKGNGTRTVATQKFAT